MAIYCKQCDFDLRHAEDSCPECGLKFSRNDPSTFSYKSRKQRRHDRLRLFFIACFIASLMILYYFFGSCVLIIIPIFMVTFFLLWQVDTPGRHQSHLMLCRNCEYDLRHADKQCPECGLKFNPAIPATYLTRTRAENRWIKAGFGFLIMMAITLIMGMCYFSSFLSM